MKARSSKRALAARWRLQYSTVLSPVCAIGRPCRSRARRGRLRHSLTPAGTGREHKRLPPRGAALAGSRHLSLPSCTARKKRRRARRAAVCHSAVQVAGFAALNFPAPAFGTRGSRRLGKATDRADKQRKEKTVELNTRNHHQHARAKAQKQQQKQDPSQAGVGEQGQTAELFQFPAPTARQREDEIVREALRILDRRYFTAGEALVSPRDAAAYLKAKLAAYPWEVFGVLFLDNRHRVLAFEEMFRGTLDGASVHPREVVRAALKHNAAAVILAHNHPSGVAEPSAADRNITRQLRDALQLIGVRVLDHLVVGAGEPTSMAARGLI